MATARLTRDAAGANAAAYMVRAFLLSIRQLADPAVLRVLARSLGVTIALFAALGIGLYYGVDALLTRFAGQGGGIAALLAVLLGVLAAWLLFRVVAIAVLGVFADDVVAAVEARYYPSALASARAVPLPRAAAMGLRSAARALLVNIVLLPAYVALLFTAVGPALLFFAANAWLLGRDLGDMVAVRHMDAAALPAWRAATRGRRATLGAVAAGLFAVPIVNLLAPIVSAALATHLFHGSRA